MLVQSRLIEPWCRMAKKPSYDPGSLAKLFDAVLVNALPEPEQGAAITLGQLAEGNPDRLMGLIAKLLSGMVRAIYWTAPYRLVDLIVPAGDKNLCARPAPLFRQQGVEEPLHGPFRRTIHNRVRSPGAARMKPQSSHRQLASGLGPCLGWSCSTAASSQGRQVLRKGHARRGFQHHPNSKVFQHLPDLADPGRLFVVLQ